MPLFKVSKNQVSTIPQANFATERTLQALVENNLGAIFNCRLVASEFPTGTRHAGRIDTLALSEDNSPVIIEYKKVESSELVNQSLYYLSWLDDHRGDFTMAAQKALGANVAIDWGEVRVICIAPNYKKYDLHAVDMMGKRIELWTYRRFQNDTFYLEEVNPENRAAPKQLVKAPVGRRSKRHRGRPAPAGLPWTFERHVEGKPALVKEIVYGVQEFMLGLTSAMEESPKKLYVAYRTTQNVVCMEVQKRKVYLFVKLNPKSHKGPEGISRDVSQLGHFGTGDLEITLRSMKDFELSKPWLEKALEAVGG